MAHGALLLENSASLAVTVADVPGLKPGAIERLSIRDTDGYRVRTRSRNRNAQSRARSSAVTSSSP